MLHPSSKSQERPGKPAHEFLSVVGIGLLYGNSHNLRFYGVSDGDYHFQHLRISSRSCVRPQLLPALASLSGWRNWCRLPTPDTLVCKHPPRSAHGWFGRTPPRRAQNPTPTLAATKNTREISARPPAPVSCRVSVVSHVIPPTSGLCRATHIACTEDA